MLTELYTDQVKVSCKFDGIKHDLEIGGRPPGVLTSEGQGDHSLFFGLVVHGFADILQDMELNSLDGLDELKGTKRNGIYDFISAIAVLDLSRKDQLYKTIENALGYYNEKRIGSGLIGAMELKASSLKDQETDKITYIDKDHEEKEGLFSEKFNDPIIRGIKELNGRYVIESLQSMAKNLLAFYNKVPHSAYLPITGFRAPKCEGAEGNYALSFLRKLDGGEVQNDRSVQEKDLSLLNNKVRPIEEKLNQFKSALLIAKKQVESLEKEKVSAKRFGKATALKNAVDSVKSQEDQVLRQKALLEKAEDDCKQQKFAFIFKKTIESLSKLVFYPEITNPEALKEHTEETTKLIESQRKSGISTALARDNNRENLITALARTIHVVFAAYPNLVEELNKIDGSDQKTPITQDNIINQFVEYVITKPYKVKAEPKGEDVKNPSGWPTKQSEIDDIANDVRSEVQQFKELQKQNHCLKDKGISSRRSSGSETRLAEKEIQEILEALEEVKRIIKEGLETKKSINPNDFLDQLNTELSGIELEKPDNLKGNYVEIIDKVKEEFSKSSTVKTKESFVRIFESQCEKYGNIISKSEGAFRS